MPDDERTRRRVSDETKGRIADLASGWTVDSDEPPATPEPEPAPRRRQKTLPPPPPGSEARRVLESEIVEKAPSRDPEVRANASGAIRKPTQPPPLPPGARKAGPTQPPPLPPQVTNKSGSVPAIPVRPSTSRQETSQPVPRGEFEHGETNVEQDKLRIAHSQSTIKRDPASSILNIAEPPLTQVKSTPVEVLLTESAEHGRGDPTSIDPKTSRFERGDPTQLGRDDASQATTGRPKAGRLRTIAALRRQRGWFGDVRYVATVMFGVRRSRRELEELEIKQTSRQAERERYLVTLGRTAVITDSFDHPALGPARERLAEVEDERARHTGQVIAADQELQRVTRDRETKTKQYTTDLASLDAELTELGKRLEPLQKQHVAATRRGADLRDALRRIDAQIQETTASLVAVRSKKDPAAIQAELATLKADKAGTQRDEPKIAAELDSLSPRIAAIEAKRSESTKRRAEMVKAEEADKGRSEELLAAIGAKRKVMDRAAHDAEELRDKILFELAERLYVDRPLELGPQLAPIDAIDVDLGSADRRLMELREILSSVDRWKLARGIAMIAGAALLVLGFAAWILYVSL